jgi:RNA polymerase sigma-70 factor (ECF subfamily)
VKLQFCFGGKTVTDTELINLYLERSENALRETEKQYGSYCRAIAMSILHNAEDSDECVNDVYLKVWEAIPPRQPNVFSAFIGKITRNLSLDRYRKKHSKKCGSGETALMLSELEACIPSALSVENEVDVNILAETIDTFLNSIRQDDMTYFMCRYWYGRTVPEIAKRFKASESKVKMSLHRTRKKLKTELEKKGVL